MIKKSNGKNSIQDFDFFPLFPVIITSTAKFCYYYFIHSMLILINVYLNTLDDLIYNIYHVLLSKTNRGICIYIYIVIFIFL